MTILSAMQSAAIRLVGQKPAVFFTASDTFELEIVDLINEVAKDICKYTDWQSLTKVYNVPTDGVTEVFDQPDDYDRQLIVTNIQDLNNWVWGYEHIDNLNDFLYRKARNFELLPGAWTIYQNQIHFFPPPNVQNSATIKKPSVTRAALTSHPRSTSPAIPRATSPQAISILATTSAFSSRSVLPTARSPLIRVPKESPIAAPTRNPPADAKRH